MNPIIYIIAIDSAIYSLSLILKKYVTKIISIETYMIVFAFCTFLITIGYLLYNFKSLTLNNNFIEIKNNFHILFLMSILQCFTAYLGFGILKYGELTYVVPIEFIFINFFALMGGIMFFNEVISAKKIVGIITGLITVYLLN